MSLARPWTEVVEENPKAAGEVKSVRVDADVRIEKTGQRPEPTFLHPRGGFDFPSTPRLRWYACPRV